VSPNHCLQCGAPLAPFQKGNRERLRCSGDGCGRIHYENPTPVVAGLVEHEGDVILVRNLGWPEGFYGLVSGFLERQESPEVGMLREVGEELGLEAEIVSLIGVYTFDLRNELIVAYHVRGRGSLRMGAELAETKRVPPEKLRPWPLGTGPAVRDWLARRRLLHGPSQ